MANRTISLTPSKMEELIGLVRQHPALYSQALKQHKDQVWTRSVWEKIARTLNVKGLTWHIVKNKWRNKRDEYRKKKMKMLFDLKSGSAASTVSKGAFFNEMSFLDPFIEDQYTVSSDPDSGQVAQLEGTDDEIIPDELEVEDSKITPAAWNFRPVFSTPSSQTSGSARQSPVVGAEISRPTLTSISPPPAACQPVQPKKNKRGNEQDAFLNVMTDMVGKYERGVEFIQSEDVRDNLDEGGSDFYRMIARRMKKMSVAMQQWMEEEVWNLYVEARKREQVRSAQNQATCHVTPQNPYVTQTSMHDMHSRFCSTVSTDKTLPQHCKALPARIKTEPTTY